MVYNKRYAKLKNKTNDIRHLNTLIIKLMTIRNTRVADLDDMSLIAKKIDSLSKSTKIHLADKCRIVEIKGNKSAKVYVQKVLFKLKEEESLKIMMDRLSECSKETESKIALKMSVVQKHIVKMKGLEIGEKHKYLNEGVVIRALKDRHCGLHNESDIYILNLVNSELAGDTNRLADKLLS